MEAPILIVNFKTYSNATGEEAMALARIHDKVAKETGANIAIAVQPVDICAIASEVSIPVLGQHFDAVEEGPFTGHITPHSIKAAGAYGSLLNHAERKMEINEIQKSIDMARTLGLFSVVCADTVYTGNAITELDPDFVAVEPPELIGGDISVCTANPQLIKDAVKMIGTEKLIIGAGIKTKDDVASAISSGASGILLSSGITKAIDPEAKLRELVEGLNTSIKC
ncbi:triose-phosphate isomerase [Pseudomonadota bacterium]